MFHVFMMGFPAHPRSRGEHDMAALTLSCACGSSPLARGTHSIAAQLVGRKRLIPARAGNTLTDHEGVTECRLIPARAGNTASRVG